MTTSPDSAPTLHEYRDNQFINCLPAILSPQEAYSALINLPDHDQAERDLPAYLRCHCVLRLNRYMDPLERQLALEAAVSIAIRQGYVGRNPRSTNYIHRLQNAYERVRQGSLHASVHDVESTAAGFCVIGCSGSGKTRSFDRTLRLYPQTIVHSGEFSLVQVPWIKLDCPTKGSPKDLCIKFFYAMDRLLGTQHRARHGTSRNSVGDMVVHMADIADRHALGILVVDEIQNLVRARGEGQEDLLNFLVSLVNEIGIPVVVVGTPDAEPVLQEKFREARRVIGVGSDFWDPMERTASWEHFVRRMWKFQWTREITPLTDDIRDLLYDRSQGIIDIVIKLFMLAQFRAIFLGGTTGQPERLDVKLLKHVADESFRLIEPMIDALRRKDSRQLATYDDLTSLQQKFDRMCDDTVRKLSPTRIGSMARATPVANPPSSDDERVLSAMENVGIGRDVATVALAEVKVESPDLSMLQVMEAISKKLGPGATAAGPGKAPRPRARKRTPASVPPDPADLRAIVTHAKAGGVSGYDALLSAGVIRSPVNDVGG